MILPSSPDCWYCVHVHRGLFIIHIGVNNNVADILAGGAAEPALRLDHQSVLVRHCPRELPDDLPVDPEAGAHQLEQDIQIQ